MRTNRFDAILRAADTLAEDLGDLTTKYPPRTPHETVAANTDRATYRMWLAWAAIMNAKHLMRDVRAEQAAKKKPCPECAGKGKYVAATVDRRELICPGCKGAGKVTMEGLS